MEIELLTDDVSYDISRLGGKPLAADALFEYFLPKTWAACGNAGGLFNVLLASPPLRLLVAGITLKHAPRPAGRCPNAWLIIPPRRDAGRGARQPHPPRHKRPWQDRRQHPRTFRPCARRVRPCRGLGSLRFASHGNRLRDCHSVRL